MYMSGGGGRAMVDSEHVYVLRGFVTKTHLGTSEAG